MNTEKVPYDAIIGCQLTKRCNMECHYCFDDVETKRNSPLETIDIDKFAHTLDDTGMSFRINFAGGEIFLIPNIVEACEKLAEKHYINFNTNLIPNRVLDFAERIDPSRVNEIHASLHIKELEQRNLTDRYIKHFVTLKEKGFPIHAKAVAHPSLLPEVEKYRTFFEERGVPFTFGHYTGMYENAFYPKAYTEEELSAFDLPRDEEGSDLYYRKGQLCNAGVNIFTAHVNGEIHPCYLVSKKLGHIYEGLDVQEKPMVCSADICGCPPEILSTDLRERVLGTGA